MAKISLPWTYIIQILAPEEGGRNFAGLRLQGQNDVSSVQNIFEGSVTEEGTGSGKAIFEGWFKFAAS